MAIENTYLLGKNITLGCGFDLQAKAPLDSRQTVPAFAGLQALIDNNAAYEGMIVYDEETKKTYQAQIVDDVLKFREFGINEAELKDLIASETTAAMEFKGAATALPENPAKGDMYKVTAAFKVGEEDAKVGDSIVYDGEQWFIIPSGDDIEDTWRPVTGVDNDATLTFAAGDKLEKTVAADGTITYKHVAIDAPTNMNEEGDEQTRTYITQLITDNHGHIIGFKTATENVEDTNTTYEFEGQSDEATSVYFQVKSSEEEAAEVIYLNAYSKNEADEALANAIAEVKTEAANQDAVVLAEAQAYADGKDAAIEAAQKAADDITGYVGTFTHDTAKTVVEYINAKTDGIATSGNLEALGQRVTVNEGKIADLETESAKHALKSELEAVDAKFADYKTAEAQKAIDDEQDRRLGVIEGDYLKAADIADFETKENVKKVADDLAAETKARSEADAGFETRIANLEANFGDGEGTVEAQIAAAVAAEAEIARAAEKANADDIDALEGRMDTAEGKITALETESAKHALKTELEAVDAKFADYTKTADLPTDLGDFTNNAGYAKTADVNTELDKKADKTQVATDIANAIAPLATTEALNGVKATAEAAAVATEVEAALALKADKSVVDAMYTNEQIDAAILVETNRAKGVEESLQTQINTIMNNPDAEGAINSINEFTQYVAEHGTIADGFRVDIDKNKEDIAANAKAIEDEAARADAAEKALAGRLDTLEAIDHEAYVAADATLKSELQDEIATAKTEAANQDAVVLAEAQSYADTAKADAIADAEGKVNALAGNVYTKDQTYTQEEVDALIAAAHTWGEF